MIKRWIPFLFICLLFLAPALSGRAQGDLTLASLEVDLWPEYDRPEMLVIYKVMLSPDVPLPADLTFRIPTRAGELNAVAERQVDGQLYTVAHERMVQGDWAFVTMTATMPEVHLEYYDSALEKRGNQRSFEFVWPGDYAVETLILQVQQPAGARDLELTPGLGEGVLAGDGLRYYTAEVGSLEAGEDFRMLVEYDKPSDALSVELQNLPVQPSQPLDVETAGRVSVREALPWVLGGLGLLLLASGVWWYVQLGREKEPERRTRRRALRAEPALEGVEADEGAVYCHQCGKRAGEGDRFCRACGTRLRR